MQNESKLQQKQLRKEWIIILKNSSIAFFDSGVGGLTVYTKLKQILPNENYIYLGDTAHMPYGEKTKNELLSYADKIFSFFISKGVKAVVMACNTTSSLIYDDIKNKYNIKIYPVIQSVAGMLAKLPVKRIGIFATPATIKSNAYKNEIHKYNKNIEIIQIECPKWVKIVEDNKINSPESIAEINSKLHQMLQYNPDKIILGCTHYPYLMKVLTKNLPENIFIDPSTSFAEYIKDDLLKNNLICNNEGLEEFFVSSDTKNFKNNAKMFYKLKNEPTLVITD